jgi:hypothetical protein
VTTGDGAGSTAKEAYMSGLAALLAGHNPPAAYQWHHAAQVDDVRHAVEHAGWQFFHLDGWTVEEREPFAKALGSALGVDDSGDLDAVREALPSVGAGHEQGSVLLWDGYGPLARSDRQTFDEALTMLRERTTQDGAFALIVRGEGPPLDLDELPLKH